MRSCQAPPFWKFGRRFNPPPQQKKGGADYVKMEINIINNKNFTKFHLKLRARGKEIYHFLVESKPHEKIDLLITASMNIYQTKKEKKIIPIVMKTCFSEKKKQKKLMKQFGTPHPPPPFQLTPLFLSNFFMTPPPSFSKF